MITINLDCLYYILLFFLSSSSLSSLIFIELFIFIAIVDILSNSDSLFNCLKFSIGLIDLFTYYFNLFLKIYTASQLNSILKPMN